MSAHQFFQQRSPGLIVPGNRGGEYSIREQISVSNGRLQHGTAAPAEYGRNSLRRGNGFALQSCFLQIKTAKCPFKICRPILIMVSCIYPMNCPIYPKKARVCRCPRSGRRNDLPGIPPFCMMAHFLIILRRRNPPACPSMKRSRPPRLCKRPKTCLFPKIMTGRQAPMKRGTYPCYTFQSGESTLRLTCAVAYFFLFPTRAQ